MASDQRSTKLTDNTSSGKWLGVASEENWQQCLKFGLWGAEKNRLSQIKKVKVGDCLLVFIKKMRISGICKVTKEYFYDEVKVWNDGVYPHRIKISPFKIPPEPIDIKELFDNSIKPKLLAKGDNSGTAGGYFAQGIRPLPIDEFTIFETEIDNNSQTIQRSRNWLQANMADSPAQRSRKNQCHKIENEKRSNQSCKTSIF